MRAINRVGHRYGRLQVMECVASTDGHNGGRWRCECECGGEIVTTGMNLAAASTRSCGCLRQTNPGASHTKRRYHETTINGQYHTHQKSAQSRGLTPLPRRDWEQLVFGPCYYCGDTDTRSYVGSGLKRQRLSKHFDANEIVRYNVRMNGVDRIDSRRGYDSDNCVPCCQRCNYMKGSLTRDEFIAQALAVWSYMLDEPNRLCSAPHEVNPYQARTLRSAFQNHRDRQKQGLGSLGYDVWRSLIFSSCHYCGKHDIRKTPSRSRVDTDLKTEMSRLLLNGVDRLDSAIGYTPSNSVACCKTCNWMKGDLPVETFVGQIDRIVQHLKTAGDL